MTPALVVVGLDHTTAAVGLRERLAVAEVTLPTALTGLLGATGLAEALLLATCNRVEVWGIERDADATTAIAGWLATQGGVGTAELTPHLYVRRGLDAVAHMAGVAAGLDSMVVGEPQILGQVKAAHAAAAAHGGAGPLLAEAVGQALRIARRARTETDVGRRTLSVSHAGVELARRIFGDLRDRAVLLVGAGEMGVLAARHLAEVGVGRLVIASRRLERAEAIARDTGGKAVPFEDLPHHAAVADILICAAAASDVLVTAAQVGTWIAHRPRPFFVIDLGVPRNVERAVGRLADVYLYDIDDLKSVVQQNRQARERETELARTLIGAAVVRLGRSAAERRAAPTIRSLRAKLEEIRQAEVVRALARLRDPSPEARAALEMLSATLVNKILHGPIEQMKAAQAAPGGARLRALVRELFGLDREGEAGDERGEVDEER